MYRYYKNNFYETPFYKSLLLLFGCGLSMGLGIATKWPGVYAAFGLALILFYTLFERYREYRYAAKHNIQDRRRYFYKYFFVTMGCCVVFFILIPIFLYFVAYIPHYMAAQNTEYMTELIPDEQKRTFVHFVLRTQEKMFNFHAHLNDVHPSSSHWYSWLIDFKPFTYYFKPINEGNTALVSSISAFGNPAFWWCGIVALFCSLSRLSRKYSATLAFVVVAYFSQLMPWSLISTRTTFIYHYFPSLPFLALLIAVYFKEYVTPKKAIAPYIYLGVVLALFGMFYPVLSGFPVPQTYVDHFLKWFPVWYFSI